MSHHCPVCMTPLSTATPPSAEARKVPTGIRVDVLAAVVEAGHNGITPAEVASHLTVPLSTVVAAFSALAAGEWLIVTSHTRGGFRVSIGTVQALELFGEGERAAA